MSSSPFHRFITFQVWAFVTVVGVGTSAALGGVEGALLGLSIYPWIGLIFGIMANEISSDTVARGI